MSFDPNSYLMEINGKLGEISAHLTDLKDNHKDHREMLQDLVQRVVKVESTCDQAVNVGQDVIALKSDMDKAKGGAKLLGAISVVTGLCLTAYKYLSQ